MQTRYNSNMKKRLFVAISIPDQTKEKLKKYIQTLPQDNMRFVSNDNYHITVLFLGYVDESLIPQLKKQLNEISNKFNSFLLSYDEITYMPKEKPRMLWAKFKENKNYASLVFEIYQIVKNLIPIELKDNPTPHITLARFKKANGKQPDIQSITINDLAINKFHLYESTLHHQGSHYKIIQTYTLRKNDAS
jgi:2'-5' RNA ligase